MLSTGFTLHCLPPSDWEHPEGRTGVGPLGATPQHAAWPWAGISRYSLTACPCAPSLHWGRPYITTPPSFPCWSPSWSSSCQRGSDAQRDGQVQRASHGARIHPGCDSKGVIFAWWCPCLSPMDVANLRPGPEPSSQESSVDPAMPPSLNPFFQDSMLAMPLLSITHSFLPMPALCQALSLAVVPEERKVHE